MCCGGKSTKRVYGNLKDFLKALFSVWSFLHSVGVCRVDGHHPGHGLVYPIQGSPMSLGAQELERQVEVSDM